jgi:hypothetical protein
MTHFRRFRPAVALAFVLTAGVIPVYAASTSQSHHVTTHRVSTHAAKRTTLASFANVPLRAVVINSRLARKLNTHVARSLAAHHVNAFVVLPGSLKTHGLNRVTRIAHSADIRVVTPDRASGIFVARSLQQAVRFSHYKNARLIIFEAKSPARVHRLSQLRLLVPVLVAARIDNLSQSTATLWRYAITIAERSSMINVAVVPMAGQLRLVNGYASLVFAATTYRWHGDHVPPTQPTNLSVGGATTTSVTLSWSPSTDNVGVAGYRLFRDGSATATQGGSPYTFTGLNCGTSHTFGVAAFDAAGRTSATSTVSGSTSACPAPAAAPAPPAPPAPTTTTSTVTTSSSTPSSGSALTWRPPGWDGSGSPSDPANYPGYTVITAPQGGGSVQLDNSKDYFIKLGHPSWSSSSSGDSELEFVGGRNRVIVGGQIDAKATNLSDDIRALLFTGGVPGAITHIEGVAINSVNGITIRSPETFQIENDRIDVENLNHDSSTGIHPDVIQTWDQGPSTIRIDHLTGITDYTGLSVLLSPDPTSVTCKSVNLHELTDGPMTYFGADHTTNWSGDVWYDTGWYNSSYRQKLDDVVYWGDLPEPMYELHGTDGASYTSPASPPGGSGTSTTPPTLGSRPGDTMTWTRVPALAGFTAHWGVPSGGDFVPAGVAGVSYASPGYQ